MLEMQTVHKIGEKWFSPPYISKIMSQMNKLMLFTYGRWCFVIIITVKGRPGMNDNGGPCGGLTAELPANIKKNWKIGMKNIYINHK